MRYSVGFAFNEDQNEVLLIRKNRPVWQNGLLNGIGGKIEAGEHQDDAMIRECKEETGLELEWKLKGAMAGIAPDNTNFEVYFYNSFNDKIQDFQQKEDEKLGIYQVNDLHFEQTIGNVVYLVHICLADENSFVTINYN